MNYPEQTLEEIKLEHISFIADKVEKLIDEDQAQRGTWFYESIARFLLDQAGMSAEISECLDAVIDDCDNPNTKHEPINRFLRAARRWEAERIVCEELEELEKSVQQ